MGKRKFKKDRAKKKGMDRKVPVKFDDVAEIDKLSDAAKTRENTSISNMISAVNKDQQIKFEGINAKTLADAAAMKEQDRGVMYDHRGNLITDENPLKKGVPAYLDAPPPPKKDRAPSSWTVGGGDPWVSGYDGRDQAKIDELMQQGVEEGNYDAYNAWKAKQIEQGKATDETVTSEEIDKYWKD